MKPSPEFVPPRLHIRNWVALFSILLLTLSAHPSHAQFFRTIPDRAESLTRPIHAGHDASPLKPRRTGASPTPYSISISAPSQEKRAAETAAGSPPGTPHRIGFGRDVFQLGSAADTAACLRWQSTPQAGMIAAISISSPEAVGIRLGILVRRLPAEAAVRFYAQEAETAYEISGKEIMESVRRNLDAGDRGDAARTYWSPHIDGEETTLEIELPPGIGPDTVEISIPLISHFFRSPLAAQGGNIIQQTGIGAAAFCEIDATCYSAWSPESNATARMIFVATDGYSYLCTGTLLNDTASSGTPYFLSANHCISQQTEASTLQTYWFYRSTSCDSGALNPGSTTLTGGAALLYSGSNTDTSFMRLINTPPAGTTYIGWDSDAPALETAVADIHHPKGDLQKISFGTIQSFQDCTATDPSGTFTCSDTTQTNAEYLNVTLTSGITEGGSSGSGLFKTSSGSHYLIGQLRGGDTSCSNPNGSNSYGRFDVAYHAALHQWLSVGSTSPLYFSHIATSAPWQTEIAIINTSDQSVTGTLKAFSDGGQLVETKNAVTLSARGRRQISVANEFINHTNIGYIIFNADSDAVQGYTKFYVAGNYRAAIPAVKEVNTANIYITHIASNADWWTGVSLVNTTSATKGLTITFNNGRSMPYTLTANQQKAFDIASLFNNQPPPDIQSAVITNASGVIGLELFGSLGWGTQLEGILLTDKTTSTIYYPHVASDGWWWTGIVAYNPSVLPCTITLAPYDAQGTPLTLSTRSIAGMGKYVSAVADLGLPAQTAWFRIDSTRPLTGFELFGTVNGDQLAAYAGGGGTGARAGVFPKIEKNGGWTGIAFVNTEAIAASVTLTAHDDNGTPVATRTLTVGGHAKVVNLAEALFSQDISGATYIAYTSNRDVVGLQLNGSADGTMLDGLPALGGTH